MRMKYLPTSTGDRRKSEPSKGSCYLKMFLQEFSGKERYPFSTRLDSIQHDGELEVSAHPGSLTTG